MATLMLWQVKAFEEHNEETSGRKSAFIFI